MSDQTDRIEAALQEIKEADARREAERLKADLNRATEPRRVYQRKTMRRV